MRAQPFFRLSRALTILLFVFVPSFVSAAVIDSQLDDSAQATRPTVADVFLAVGYVPTHDLSISGVRFRVNASGSGDYVCPAGDIYEYFGTSSPAIWNIGVLVGDVVPFATTTPDANGNCNYTTINKYGQNSPIPMSHARHYVFFMATGGSYAKWVSMSGKPRVSTTTQSHFGYRNAGHNFYIWGTTGLDEAYFEFFDTAPPPATPPDPCAAPGACASSVLFLPGIEASRLYRPDYALGTTKLWEPFGDGDARDLFMDESGESIRHDVYTKDVVGEAYGTLNIYKSFLADLAEWKNSGVINDYRAAPYDWRVSLDDVLDHGREMPDGRLYYSGDLRATTTPYIIQELRRLAAGSQTGKVTIVAHSNGGLVAKALVKRLQDAHDPLLGAIDSLIMVAVPQAGTPQAVGALLHGYEQGLPRDWLSLFLTPATARAFAANLPSAYNLLPSAEYFTYVDDPVVEFDDSGLLAEFRARYGDRIHDGAQLKSFITDARRLASSSPSDLAYPSVGNVALYPRAEAFHAAADAWEPPPGIALHEVAGWGEGTLATIRYYEGKKTVCAAASAPTCSSYTTAPTLLYEPKEVIEGDGTVLVPSALWTSASTTQKYWVDLENYNKWWLNGNVTRKHADILEIPSLRTLIRNILTNATSTTLDFITTTQPATDAVVEERLRFVLHSPLDLSAADNLGNVVSSTTSAIPGGRWKRYGEVQVLTVPKGAPITLALAGLAAGSFTLDMQEVDGNDAVVASSTLSAVPSATSTRATMALADGTVGNASPLRVDYDGDGDTDFSLRPETGKTTVFDATPPEAVLTLDPLMQRLEIIGIDDLSETTVSTTATSSTVTDEAGNTLQIIFNKLKQGKRELKLEIRELRYNGASAGGAPRNALQYEWSADKMGNIRELEQEARTGSSEAEAHYSAKKNMTRIEDDESEENLPGLVVIGLKTKKGNIIIDY